MTKDYDVIVVGSGAGGSTVAREMIRRGKTVLLIERGGRTEIMGNSLSVALILDNFGFTRSKEKLPVTFADNFGGLSNLAAGCALQPPGIVFDPVGIDLSSEIEESKKEMWIQQLPDELIGEANLRLLSAAHDAGYHWKKLENFIDAEKCVPNCSNCMLGCKRGAKFTARVYGDEAVRNGADLMLRTTVREVLVEAGNVIGVTVAKHGKTTMRYGKMVVLSAGVGNTHILRRAGIDEAGRGFCCDFLQFVGAVIPGMNTRTANPMTVGTLEHYESDGMTIVPVFPNWSQFALLLWFMGVPYFAKMPEFWKYSGIMVKIRDETAGDMYEGRAFSKPLTRADKQKLDKGVSIIEKIFSRAGARAGSMFATLPLGAHPSATCRIGEVVDSNLETRIGNLFCCDASVFPASLGLPTVWTVVSLAKRLAKHLEQKLDA